MSQHADTGRNLDISYYVDRGSRTRLGHCIWNRALDLEGQGECMDGVGQRN